MSSDSQARAFFAAILAGDAAAVEQYLGKGADPNGRDAQQRPALYLAASHGHVEVVRTLVCAGADVNCQIGDDPEAAARSRAAAGAVASSASRSPDGYWERHHFHNYSPLKVACRLGHVAVLRALIEAGADVEYGQSTQSALYIACEHNQPEAVRVLLDAGAAPNGKSNWLLSYGRSGAPTPLVVATRSGHEQVVRLLIEHGAPVARWRAERLHVACRSGDLDLARAVLEEGHDPNEATEEGYGPLLVACGAGNVELVRLLLDHRAVVTAQAVERAAESGFRELTALLLQHLALKPSLAAIKRVKGIAVARNWPEVRAMADAVVRSRKK